MDRFRDFFVRTYLNKFTLEILLQEKLNSIARYAYIVHDKDDCAEHIHLCIRFVDRKSINVVQSFFPHNNINEEEHQSTYVEVMSSERSACRYLLHLDDPDKYQYEESEVTNYKYNLETHFCSDYNVGVGDTATNALIDLLNGATFRDTALKYGRDFIYHCHAYKTLLEVIQIQEAEVQSTAEQFEYEEFKYLEKYKKGEKNEI